MARDPRRTLELLFTGWRMYFSLSWGSLLEWGSKIKINSDYVMCGTLLRHLGQDAKQTVEHSYLGHGMKNG